MTEYEQVGDEYKADDINATNKAVNELNADIDETKKSVADGKALIASAITDKGVTTAADAAFSVMANNIKNIKTTSTIKERAY